MAKKRFDQLTSAEEARAIELHRRCVFVNGLEPSSLHCFDDAFLANVKASGMTAANKTVILHELRNQHDYRLGPNHDSLLAKVGDYVRFAASHADRVTLVDSVEDIVEAKKTGKFGIILGLQDAASIGDDINSLAALDRLGIRILQLSYSVRSKLADGCGEKSDAGLSLLGFEVIKEMNRLGMVVDMSHCGHRSSMDAIEASPDPIIFSHANAYSVYPVARNKTDEAIKALAKKGGVIGCMGYAPSVQKSDVPTLEDYLDHIDYIAKLVGPEFVGIGVDYPHHYSTPEWGRYMEKAYSTAYTISKAQIALRGMTVKDLDAVELFPNITRGLVARGYSDGDIENILGGNFMRVFKAVWKGGATEWRSKACRVPQEA
jgi:membrane dipeptidase